VQRQRRLAARLCGRRRRRQVGHGRGEGDVLTGACCLTTGAWCAWLLCPAAVL
jgi:hypothetical protein